MAQPKDLKIRYTYVGETGGVERKECFLSEIPEEHKATISDILIYNTTGVGKDSIGAYITSTIQGFPLLQKLYLPEEYKSYISNAKFKDCPSLKTFFTVGKENLSAGAKVSRISGGIAYADANEASLHAFNADAGLLENGEEISYIVSRESVTVETNSEQAKYICNAEEQIKKLQAKIKEINALISEDVDKVQIDKDMLVQVFSIVENRGVDANVFNSEFDKIYEAISKINVNSIEQSTINETVNDILVGGINSILEKDFEHVAKKVIEKAFKEFSGKNEN